MKEFIAFLKNKRYVAFLLIGAVTAIACLIMDSVPPNNKQTTRSRDENEEYTDTLERKTEALLNEIDGVSDAEVMIVLKSSSEQVFASDNNDSVTKHVIADGSPVIIKKNMPEIQGVAVVCKGGNNPVIKAKITELICSALGIYSTHVYITE